MTYLDVASTTKPRKEVIKAMMPYFEKFWSNPSSLYSPSVEVKDKIEQARWSVGKFIGAKGDEIFFTSGGSESNCWAITGFINECWSRSEYAIVITSTIEHKSIIDCVENSNADFHFIGVDKQGFIDINKLEELLIKVSEFDIKPNCNVLVSIQFANNEIGTIQPIKEIAALAHKYGGIFHTDAVQAFGHLPFNVYDLDVDMLSVSGHKVGCPKGIGFLYKKTGINIKPLIYGSQMDGMRGGTENVPYIIGMARAVRLLEDEQSMARDMCVELLKNNFINKLRKFGCTINGSLDNRLINNVNVTFPNITGEALLYMLDTAGIYASTGSACNSYDIEPSHVLKAIGLTNIEAMKTVRFTLPDDITEEQINKVIDEIDKAIKITVI